LIDSFFSPNKLKKLKNNWYNYFIFVSFVFIVIYLYINDLYKFPVILSLHIFLLSVILFIISFFIGSFAWYIILLKANYPVNYFHASYSFGVAVIGKYIPGKIWSMIGQSGFIFKNNDYNKKDIISLTFIEQIIALWVGMVIGSFSLFYLEDGYLYGWLIFFLLLILSFIIFTKVIHKSIDKVSNKIFKKEIKIPFLSLKDSLTVIIIYTIFWIVVGFSSFLFAASILQDSVSFNIGLGVILAINIGFLIIFLPSGLGAREGVLILFLKSIGLTLEDSAMISISHRILTVLCEVIFFVIVMIINKMLKKAEKI